MGTLDQAHDQGVIIGIAAERAGMTLSDRDNPSVTELAWEARRLGVSMCTLFDTADTAVSC
ncbi:hypothetical protein [Curtobacterium sp. MCSS17_015]|uniref:hypothetical protein n=1 Tax=Curtobacterium sp. MCSS17_015 TaxID=2175666 RepID=UPI000DAA70D7|nr:hypothetical protein [Curtobacterium sp. MCSS17_015]WIB25863.1 hypothetical protein DEJ18_12505 [Curtobacterium sp. MCSS17_015]